MPVGMCHVRYACISHDFGRQAGRTGVGAVMGGKTLKALAVKGTASIPVANLKQAYANFLCRHLDMPPARLYEDPIADGPNQGHVLTKEDIHNLLTWYYTARGGNENGIPTGETLIKAGLAEVAEDLAALGP